MKARYLISLIALLASCSTNPRGEIAMTAESYIRTEYIVEILLEEAGEWNEFLAIPAPSEELSYLHLIILTPPEWTVGEIHPSSGSWIVRYSLAGSPDDLWYNVAFHAVPGGKPLAVPMAMGESLTTRELFDDAVHDVLAAARLKLKEEGVDVRIDAEGPWKPVVAYTFLVRPPNLKSDNTATTGWREKWIVRMNRTDTEIWVDFLPDGEGGTDIVVTAEANGGAGRTPGLSLPELGSA